MKEISDFRNNHKSWKRSTIIKRFSLKDVNDLNRIERYVKTNGNSFQKWERINKYTLSQYRNARKQFLQVHSVDLSRWALECARKEGE